MVEGSEKQKHENRNVFVKSVYLFDLVITAAAATIIIFDNTLPHCVKIPLDRRARDD